MQPPIPQVGFLWVPGYWAWNQPQADYFWVPGTWVEAPQAGLLWTPGYWAWNDSAFVFRTGYWAAHVGFYGGVDYGFGYTGNGYLGGRWQNGAFFYNRTVNNIGTVHITNVYNETVVVDRTTNYVSYNGGAGGIEARPTPEQEAVAKEQHVEATAMQTRQVEAASKERALFSKENHGQPRIAATSKAGIFEGEGVSPARRPENANSEAPKQQEPTAATATPENKGGEPKPERQGAIEKTQPKDETGKPERQGETEKAAPKDEVAKPDRKGETEKAAPKDEVAKPDRKGEMEKAAPKDEMAKPERKAEPAKPEVKGEINKPEREAVKPERRAETTRPEPKREEAK